MTGIRKEASFVSVATAVGLITAALAGGAWVGAVENDVESLKQAQVQQTEDHDRLIKVETKVETIEDDVRETKADVKEILRVINELNRG